MANEKRRVPMKMKEYPYMDTLRPEKPTGNLRGSLVEPAGRQVEVKVDTPKEEPLGSFKKGGIVSKTGTYELHEGEKIIPASSSSGSLRAGSWQRPVPPTQTAHEAKHDEAAMNAGKASNQGTSESGTHKSIPQSMEPIGKMTDQPEAPHGRNYPGRALPKNK